MKAFGVCDFSRLAVTDWRLRRWRLWFLAFMTATLLVKSPDETGVVDVSFQNCVTQKIVNKNAFLLVGKTMTQLSKAFTNIEAKFI